MYLRARNFGISYLPQEPSVFRKLTVEENILAVLEAQPLGNRERRTRTERLINQLNLGHIRTTRGYALSGGERRRVEIARALCIQPNFILLDEPFSGIDPIAVLELQKIIFDLKASGIGVLITDHNVRETLSVTDRAYIIAEGQDLPRRNAARTGQRRGGAAGLPGRGILAGLKPLLTLPEEPRCRKVTPVCAMHWRMSAKQGYKISYRDSGDGPMAQSGTGGSKDEPHLL